MIPAARYKQINANVSKSGSFPSGKPHPKHQVSVRFRTAKAGLPGISQGVLTTTSRIYRLRITDVYILTPFLSPILPKFLSSPQAAVGGSSVSSGGSAENI